MFEETASRKVNGGSEVASHATNESQGLSRAADELHRNGRQIDSVKRQFMNVVGACSDDRRGRTKGSMPIPGSQERKAFCSAISRKTNGGTGTRSDVRNGVLSQGQKGGRKIGA